MKRIKQIIKKLLLVDEGPKPLFYRKQIEPLKVSKKNGFTCCEFGNLNNDKTFYIINRVSHAGIFSYLSFIFSKLVFNSLHKEKSIFPSTIISSFYLLSLLKFSQVDV